MNKSIENGARNTITYNRRFPVKDERCGRLRLEERETTDLQVSLMAVMPLRQSDSEWPPGTRQTRRWFRLTAVRSLVAYLAQPFGRH